MTFLRYWHLSAICHFQTFFLFQNFFEHIIEQTKGLLSGLFYRTQKCRSEEIRVGTFGIRLVVFNQKSINRQMYRIIFFQNLPRACTQNLKVQSLTQIKAIFKKDGPFNKQHKISHMQSTFKHKYVNINSKPQVLSVMC